MDRLLYLFILHEVRSHYCATFEVKSELQYFTLAITVQFLCFFRVDTVNVQNLFVGILVFPM